MTSRVALPSGLWAGHYEQYGFEFPQRMVIEFADGIVRGDGIDDIGPFTLDGEYRADGTGVRLGWIKTYEGAHSVLYLGTLEGAEIRGEWSLVGGRGGFALAPRRGAGLEPHERKRAR